MIKLNSGGFLPGDAIPKQEVRRFTEIINGMKLPFFKMMIVQAVQSYHIFKSCLEFWRK